MTSLKIDPEPFLKKPVKVIANLPYNIGTELLIRFLTNDGWPPYWETLTLMFQSEVAQRITAKVGSKAYGRLSSRLHYPLAQGQQTAMRTRVLRTRRDTPRRARRLRHGSY